MAKPARRSVSMTAEAYSMLAELAAVWGDRPWERAYFKASCSGVVEALIRKAHARWARSRQAVEDTPPASMLL